MKTVNGMTYVHQQSLNGNVNAIDTTEDVLMVDIGNIINHNYRRRMVAIKHAISYIYIHISGDY